MYSPTITDDSNEEDPEYNYILVYSSKRCKHSKRLIQLMKQLNIDPSIQITPIDIVDLIRQRKEIPNYINYVPALVISNPIIDTLQSIKYGDEIHDWLHAHTPKKSYTESGGFASKNFYGRVKFRPQIKTDKHGRPLDESPSQFIIADMRSENQTLDTALSDYNKEYSSLSAELGHQNTHLYGGGSGSGSSNDEDDESPIKSFNTGRGAPVGGAPVGGVSNSDGKNKGRISSYNA